MKNIHATKVLNMLNILLPTKTYLTITHKHNQLRCIQTNNYMYTLSNLMYHRLSIPCHSLLSNIINKQNTSLPLLNTVLNFYISTYIRTYLSSKHNKVEF